MATRKSSKHGAGVFDIRTIIGALLGIYGIVLVVLGMVDHDSGDSGGINLLTGIGMIVVAALLILWAVTRPIVVDEVELAKDKAAAEADVAAVKAVEAADRTGQGDAGSH